MCTCEDRPCCGHHLEEDRYPTDPLDLLDDTEDRYAGNVPERGDAEVACADCETVIVVDPDDLEDVLAKGCETCGSENLIVLGDDRRGPEPN